MWKVEVGCYRAVGCVWGEEVTVVRELEISESAAALLVCSNEHLGASVGGFKSLASPDRQRLCFYTEGFFRWKMKAPYDGAKSDIFLETESKMPPGSNLLVPSEWPKTRAHFSFNHLSQRLRCVCKMG